MALREAEPEMARGMIQPAPEDLEESFTELGPDSASNGDPGAFQQMLESIRGHLGASSGFLLLSKPVNLQVAVGKRVPGGRKRLAALIQNSSRPALFDPYAPGLSLDVDGRKHGLVVPLRIDDLRSGGLVLVRPARSEPFNRADLGLAGLIGDQISLLVDRQSHQTELREAQEAAHRAGLQLERFAFDIKATFNAEKLRATELADALGELQHTYRATVQSLAVAVEAKDSYTGGHIFRVTQYGLAMMSLIAPDQAQDTQFEYGFLLHDIGKLAVPDAILGKEGGLDDDEWVLMRSHAETGRRILEGIPFLSSATEIVHAHHERWDGKGYPRGLKGEQIPLGARVFPVADSFDAMTSTRPYRKAMPTEVALDELIKGSGTQFWPEAVQAFMSLPLTDIEAIRASVQRSLR